MDNIFLSDSDSGDSAHHHHQDSSAAEEEPVVERGDQMDELDDLFLRHVEIYALEKPVRFF